MNYVRVDAILKPVDIHGFVWTDTDYAIGNILIYDNLINISALIHRTTQKLAFLEVTVKN